jgi:hypothetical protein
MYDANGDDYVSPYLLRRCRSIEEVLEARGFRGADGMATERGFSPPRDGSLSKAPAVRTTKPSAARRSE